MFFYQRGIHLMIPIVRTSPYRPILAAVFAAISVLMIISITGCSKDDSNDKAVKADGIQEITLMTHDSFSASTDVIQAFEQANHAKIIFLKSGDAGEALNKAILSKNNPIADIFYGVDNTFLTRALSENIFVAHDSPLLDRLPESLRLDPENRLIPVDFGDVCINFDIAWFKQRNLDPPVCLEDLLAPRFKDLVVVENPATSSPGLAFLLATVARFGQTGYLDFWKGMKQNQVMITSGWKEAYWGQFTAASKGTRPVVVSYASSPAAEVYYAKNPMDKAPTGVMVDNGAAFRQVEFAGILKGTKKLELAGKLMDFLVSKTFQEDIPLQMFVFPANKEAVLPDVFKKHAVITDQPARLDYDIISKNRESWIINWTELML
ncbi:TbpA [Desulforapulum autotrophicum HRM2]|uniref:TbpA n=2 Tax=Desulforapulum autotrophicum TaxID=2296 RepID=C0QEL3_DESAH|nr:TbpA [Desulforapulum autotrophicum HRM2]